MMNKLARIDKLVLSNIQILDIEDKDKLIEKGVLEDTPNGNKYRTYRTLETFTKLKLSDGFVDGLTAGVKVIPTKEGDTEQHYYCILSLSVKNGTGTNLESHTAEGYREQLERTKEHLLNEYGIHILTDFATVKEIEINKTFVTEYAFDSYYRPLKLLFSNLPKRFKTESEYINREEQTFETIYAKAGEDNKTKRYFEIIAYDKTKQLENKLKLDEEYMRVEFKVKGTQKVNAELSTNQFNAITDDLINAYYSRKVDKLFQEPLEKWKKQRNKELVRLIKELKQANQYKWQTDFLLYLTEREISDKGVPTLLDIKELIPILKNIGLSKQRNYTVRKSLCAISAKNKSIFCNKDDTKLNEIMGKLYL